LTVKELFEAEKIDITFISEVMPSTPYWQSCDRFVEQNWKFHVESLSPRQAAWLTKILDDCVEKRIEG
jgi:hypothetical protein